MAFIMWFLFVCLFLTSAAFVEKNQLHLEPFHQSEQEETSSEPHEVNNKSKRLTM